MLLLLGIYILKMSLYSSLSVQCTLRRTSKSVLTFFPMSVEDKTRSPETDDCGLATPHLRGAAGSSWSSSLVDSGQSGLSRLPSRCCRERRGARARGRPRAPAASRVAAGRASPRVHTQARRAARQVSFVISIRGETRRERSRPTPPRGARPPQSVYRASAKVQSARGARGRRTARASAPRGVRRPRAVRAFPMCALKSTVYSLQYTYGPTTPTHDG